MTVVAWDGSTLAADKRCSDGSMIRTVTKVFRVGDLLVAGSGTRSMIMQMIEWVRAGRAVTDFPPMQRDKDDWQPILVIEADGTPSQYDRTPYPSRFEDRCCAIGSGRDFAMAAMHLGKTAREAVEVACALDSGCGNGIDTLAWAARSGHNIGGVTVDGEILLPGVDYDAKGLDVALKVAPKDGASVIIWAKDGSALYKSGGF